MPSRRDSSKTSNGETWYRGRRIVDQDTGLPRTKFLSLAKAVYLFRQPRSGIQKIMVLYVSRNMEPRLQRLNSNKISPSLPLTAGIGGNLL